MRVSIKHNWATKTPFERAHTGLACVENYYPELVGDEWCVRVCIRLYSITTGNPYVLPAPTYRLDELASMTVDDATLNYINVVHSSIGSMGNASANWHAMSKDEKNECLRAMKESVSVALADMIDWYKRAKANADQYTTWSPR